MKRLVLLLALAVCWSGSCPANEVEPKGYFAIRVVDRATGRGVPLVELRTVHAVRYVTDSAGWVAFYEPGLMDKEVFFFVTSHGYQFPKDGFGMAGVRLKTVPGGEATLKIDRVNVAERLYRVTGAGIYRDSVLLGRPVPIRQPLLNALVFGSDSINSVVYRGKIYWFWGDTSRPSYPLGNFHVPGATSLLPADGGLDPDQGVDLEYFLAPDGFAKPTAQMPGEGPTWIDALVVLTDAEGQERMFAKYVKVAPPMRVYERGLVEWNDEQKRFEKRLTLDMAAPVVPAGHTMLHTDGGKKYVYFCEAYPLVRVPAEPEALLDPSRYEAYTYFKPGSRADEPLLDRGADGSLRLGWKTDAPPLEEELEAKLVASGQLRPEERWFVLSDLNEPDKRVRIARSSVFWNKFRQRWIMIGLESWGTSMLGEIWYAEAPQPLGPWRLARKIVTHDRYSFYNPKQHPMFDQQDGRVIYFEGTYTHTFSGNPEQTPRYDYNQIMYRLDLADPRLHTPQ